MTGPAGNYLPHHLLLRSSYVYDNKIILIYVHNFVKTHVLLFQEMKPSHVHIYHSVNGTSVELVFPLTAKDTRSGGGTMDLVLQLIYDPFESCPRDLKISQNGKACFSIIDKKYHIYL